jgi:hypothetical protein
MSELTPHPLAEIFPRLDGADLTALADDIRKNGLRQAIVTCEGMVLDGRNRLAACKIAGVEPRFKEFAGDDPLDYVISLNLTRRHLDASQRAIIAAKIAPLKHGANQHQISIGKFAAPQICGPQTQGQAAEMLNVSERSVRDARLVLDKGDLEIIGKVESGKISVSSAAKSLRPPAGPMPGFQRIDEPLSPAILEGSKRMTAELRAIAGQAVGDIFKGTHRPAARVADKYCPIASAPLTKEQEQELRGGIASLTMVGKRLKPVANAEVLRSLAETIRLIEAQLWPDRQSKAGSPMVMSRA